MEINYNLRPELKIKTNQYKIEIENIIKELYPVLKKYKANPPQIGELLGKNARWSCGVKGISIKIIKESSSELKSRNTIIKDIVEASINRKYLLNNDGKNKARYQEIKEIIEELKEKKIYQPKPAPKNQFKGFNFELETQFGTKIKTINRESAKVLIALDFDLQPILKTFNIELKKLHETQSSVKEGHNRNKGQVIAIKVKDRNYLQIFYTALHELAHSKEFNHGEGFKNVLGQLVLWCYYNKYPTPIISKEILRMAQSDIKYKPNLKQ